ncbi:MAG: glycosyltransferase [Verrucomicrobiota bacterium]
MALALWNHLLWRWGKRIARLRGLAAVAAAGPVAVLSGHGVEVYAGEEELRAALPGADLVFADTRAVPATAWSRLFRTGKFQVQITDPQSVEGGLPFRVFECGACAVPLLSDYRPELGALFPASHGIYSALDEPSLQTVAAEMVPPAQGRARGTGAPAARGISRPPHLGVRWRQLVEGRELRSQSPYPQPAPRPAPAPVPLVTQVA